MRLPRPLRHPVIHSVERRLRPIRLAVLVVVLDRIHCRRRCLLRHPRRVLHPLIRLAEHPRRDRHQRHPRPLIHLALALLRLPDRLQCPRQRPLQVPHPLIHLAPHRLIQHQCLRRCPLRCLLPHRPFLLIHSAPLLRRRAEFPLIRLVLLPQSCLLPPRRPLVAPLAASQPWVHCSAHLPKQFRAKLVPRRRQVRRPLLLPPMVS